MDGIIGTELSEHVAANIEQIDCTVSSIDHQLSRKKMKVSIFGETSSGKSTTANALIGKDLLPSGMADTTSCFLELQIMKETFYNNSYFVVCDGVDGVGTEHQKHFLNESGIEQLEDMSNAGSESSIGASKIIRIFLKPQDVNVSLLARDIQIMDCPGISSCRELGDKVKKFCADSDVHIFVVSSKAVMSIEAMDHLLEVGKRLPKPDVIIAFTHWDLSVNERHPERVKVRHVDKAFELLKKLGTVEEREEAEQRCFFISSTEAKDIAVDNENDFTALLLGEKATASSGGRTVKGWRIWQR
ncbi:transmembrane GTPase Marf-like [Diadema antillarum]|uniref:transmembrane GTPase Marf-like n=1 Tax=Diadema antillarum TaxID=105358 RepID=UPI003A87E528